MPVVGIGFEIYDVKVDLIRKKIPFVYLVFIELTFNLLLMKYLLGLEFLSYVCLANNHSIKFGVCFAGFLLAHV